MAQIEITSIMINRKNTMCSYFCRLKIKPHLYYSNVQDVLPNKTDFKEKRRNPFSLNS
jgi:hypothetical protein